MRSQLKNPNHVHGAGLPEPESPKEKGSIAGSTLRYTVETTRLPEPPSVEAAGVLTEQGSAELVRSVTGITFSDPFTALLSDELTFENRTKAAISRITILKGESKMDAESTLYSNLRFFDPSKSRLELQSSRDGDSDKLTVILKNPLNPGEQQTIYMEYVHTFRHIEPGLKGRLDLRTLMSRLLFREPKYDFPFFLGEWSTYVYVQPAPRLQLRIDKIRSIIPSRISTTIGHPERRNALNIRFDGFPKEKAVLEQILLEYWKDRGVAVNTGKLPQVLVKGFEARKWWFAILSRLVPLERVRGFVLRQYRNEIKTVSQEIIDKRKVRVTVRQSLPGSLKIWLYAVFTVAFGSAFLSPSLTVSASVIALLAITRSWLFYEEEMMKPAGNAALTLFILNFLGIFALAVSGKVPYLAYKEAILYFLRLIH